MFRELYFLHADELAFFGAASHQIGAAAAAAIASNILREPHQRSRFRNDKEMKRGELQVVETGTEPGPEAQLECDDMSESAEKQLAQVTQQRKSAARVVEKERGDDEYGRKLSEAVSKQEDDKKATSSRFGDGDGDGAGTGDGVVTWSQLLLGVNFQCYLLIHICAAIIFPLSFSWKLLGLSVISYIIRMFGITGGYHRLLSHRSYKTSRPWQFVMAAMGCAAMQKGPLWWCSHHRHHHRTADTKQDVHSPLQFGFWWSHIGWFLLSAKNVQVKLSLVPDLARFPELRCLDRYHYLPPLAMVLLLFIGGGLPAVGWGFVISTVLCWHATYAINSIAHLVGTKRYRCEFNTHCDARNNLWLALLTLGEGWHNNHHCYMRSARHGFYSHEIDVTYYVLLILEWLGIIWDLEMPPFQELEGRRYDKDSYKCRCTEVEKDLAACMR